MNIVYLINSASFGGAEKHLLDLASGMVKKGHKVWIFSPSGPMVSEFPKKGIHYEELSPRFDLDFAYISKVKRFLKVREIDVLHTHLLKSTVNGLIAGYLAKTKMKVAHIHGSLISWEVPWYKKYSNIFANTLIQNICADKVIALTESVRRELIGKEKIRKEKIVVIPNGIDIRKYEKKKRKYYFHEKYGWDKEIQVIGTIGRLTVERGQKYFIEAAKYLVDNGLNVRFVVVGGGELQKEYEILIHKLGLDKYVFLEGFVSENIKKEILQSLDIYVSPAIREGFGLALVEAMASSRPIVATNLEVTKEVCPDNECAILVESSDGIRLAEGIKLLLEDKKKQNTLAEKAYEKASREYSLDAFVNNYHNLYIEFLKGR